MNVSIARVGDLTGDSSRLRSYNGFMVREKIYFKKNNPQGTVPAGVCVGLSGTRIVFSC